MSTNEPGFAPYPRTGQGANAERLRLLADAYFQLNKVFLINVGLAVALGAANRSGSLEQGSTLNLLVLLVFAVVIAGLCYKPLEMIGGAKNWSPSRPKIYAALMGLNSAFCCGIIGYILAQRSATVGLSEGGIKTGFFASKSKIYDQIDALER